MVAPAALITCQHLRKSFPGVIALDDVGLEIRAGSVHALVGENGAGKSTLVKILAGAHQPDSGSVLMRGANLQLRDARVAQNAGIAVVYQEHNLVNDLSVSENIFLGRWPKSRYLRRVDFGSLRRQAQHLLDSLRVTLPLAAPVRALTVAQQQMVEIAKALSLDAQLLILDEPSAVLTPHELQALFRLIRDLQKRGVGIVYISHRLDEVFELADEVSVLRDGKHIWTRQIGDVDREQLISAMVGRELRDEFPPREAHPGADALIVDKLTASGRFENVSFRVRQGEIFALTGLVGAGRSSVLQALFGAIPVSSGTIRLRDVTGPFRSPVQAIAAGLAYLPESRKQDGLLLERSIFENVTLSNLAAYTRGPLLSHEKERVATRRLVADLQIKAPRIDAAVNTLSGGNQQKVLLARWMDRPHRIILFDEPTRGVDVGAKYEIYLLMNRLVANGVSIVMVSSELPEVIGMADRIAVMHEGCLMGILDNRARSVTQEQIIRLASGERNRDGLKE